MRRICACGAIGFLLASFLIACAPAGDVIIPAGQSGSVGAEGEAAAGANGASSAGLKAFAEPKQPQASMTPVPSSTAGVKPTAQYASVDEFTADIARFPFGVDAFPARLDAAAERFGSGVRCPALTYSELTEGHFGEITDTVFIHLHAPGGDGIYEISVGEIGALAGKATPHDAFVQTALSVLGAVGDLSQDQAMEMLDALRVSDPASSGKAYMATNQHGYRVTMEVRDGVDLRFAVHPLTPREEKQP